MLRGIQRWWEVEIALALAILSRRTIYWLSLCYFAVFRSSSEYLLIWLMLLQSFLTSNHCCWDDFDVIYGQGFRGCPIKCLWVQLNEVCLPLTLGLRQEALLSNTVACLVQNLLLRLKLLIWLDGHRVAGVLTHCYLSGCAWVGQLCRVDRLLVVLVGTLFADWILGATLLFYHNRTGVLYICYELVFIFTSDISSPLAFLVLDEFVWLLCFKGALWVLETLILLNYVLIDEVSAWWHEYLVTHIHRRVTQRRIIVLLDIDSSLAKILCRRLKGLRTYLM